MGSARRRHWQEDGGLYQRPAPGWGPKPAPDPPPPASENCSSPAAHPQLCTRPCPFMKCSSNAPNRGCSPLPLAGPLPRSNLGERRCALLFGEGGPWVPPSPRGSGRGPGLHSSALPTSLLQRPPALSRSLPGGGGRVGYFNSRKTRPQRGTRRQRRQLNKQPRSCFQAPCSLAALRRRPLEAKSGAASLGGHGGSPPAPVSQLLGPTPSVWCSVGGVQTLPPRPGFAFTPGPSGCSFRSLASTSPSD